VRDALTMHPDIDRRPTCGSSAIAQMLENMGRATRATPYVTSPLPRPAVGDAPRRRLCATARWQNAPERALCVAAAGIDGGEGVAR